MFRVCIERGWNLFFQFHHKNIPFYYILGRMGLSLNRQHSSIFWMDSYVDVYTHRSCLNLLSTCKSLTSQGTVIPLPLPPSLPLSSQLAEPLWTDPGLKSGISVRKLISTLKKNISAGREWMVEHLPKSSQVRKKPSTPSMCTSS